MSLSIETINLSARTNFRQHFAAANFEALNQFLETSQSYINESKQVVYLSLLDCAVEYNSHVYFQKAVEQLIALSTTSEQIFDAMDVAFSIPRVSAEIYDIAEKTGWSPSREMFASLLFVYISSDSVTSAIALSRFPKSKLYVAEVIADEYWMTQYTENQLMCLRRLYISLDILEQTKKPQGELLNIYADTSGIFQL